MPDEELTGEDSVYEVDEELETVTCVVLVIVDVSTVLVVEVTGTELDELVTAPEELLPGADELLAYDELLAGVDDAAELVLTGAEEDTEEPALVGYELEPAGTTAVDEEDVEAGLELVTDGALLVV